MTTNAGAQEMSRPSTAIPTLPSSDCHGGIRLSFTLVPSLGPLDGVIHFRLPGCSYYRGSWTAHRRVEIGRSKAKGVTITLE